MAQFSTLRIIHANIMNLNITLSICLYVAFSRLYRYTDFNGIMHEESLMLNEGHRLLFTAITNIHADGRSCGQKLLLV